LDDAVHQIQQKGYDIEMRSRGIQEILKIGIAFAGKNVKTKQI
jgi:hypothetical protein